MLRFFFCCCEERALLNAKQTIAPLELFWEQGHLIETTHHRRNKAQLRGSGQEVVLYNGKPQAV